MEGFLKRIFVKELPIILFCAVLCLLGGCGKKEDDSRNYVYSAKEVDTGVGSQLTGSSLLKIGNEILLYGLSSNYDTGEKNEVFAFLDQDGNMKNSFSFPLMQSENCHDVTQDGLGNIFCLFGLSAQTENEAGVEETMDAGMDMGMMGASSNNDFVLIKFDSNGNELIRKGLFDEPVLEKIKNPELGEWTNHYIIYDNSFVYVIYDSNIIKYDSDFNYVSHVQKSKASDVYKSLDGVVRSNTGEIYLSSRDEHYNLMISQADLDNGESTIPIPPPGSGSTSLITSGISTNFTTIKNGCLYGFDYADKDIMKIADFTASNVATDYVKSVTGIDEKHFYAIYRSIEDDGFHLCYFSKMNPEDVVTKKTLTLATTYNYTDIKKAVVAFNKSNPEYNINLVDYNAMYGNTESYYTDPAVIEQLNMDIISGQMPDMLITSNQSGSGLPIDTYIHKNLIEDLFPYIENDPDYSLSDMDEYMVNDVFAKEGKLYSLIPAYTVNTVMVKSSLVGDKKSWTLDEIEEIYDKVGAKFYFAYVRKEDILKLIMKQSGEQFIDWDNGKCYFDSDYFKQIIEFINGFPNSDSYTELNGHYNDMYVSNFVLGNATANVSGFKSVYWNEVSQYFEPVSFIGMPTNNGQGSTIAPSVAISMSSKSKYKDGCWEFLRYFLSDEYQTYIAKGGYSGFPVMRKAYEQMMIDAQEIPYDEWTDMEGVVHRERSVAYINDEMVEMPAMPKERVDAVDEFIHSVKYMDRSDDKVMAIISDECEDYFEDKATLDDIVKRIQSRVQIYIYEIQ